jgi:threonine dehydrogenase-like Zn-dependent dehydrogenase
VLECVGLEQSELTAISIARPGGAVGRVGVPENETMPASRPAFYNNISVRGGRTSTKARSTPAASTRTFCFRADKDLNDEIDAA